MRQIVIDTETTGLSPKEGHRIIEVGCLELVNRRITGNTWHRYINPQRPIERDAELVHGITHDFLQDKPIFSTIANELKDYIAGAELIIHNAPFDLGFLNHEFSILDKKHSLIQSECDVIDTLELARSKHPGQQNSLDALCRRYHVDNSQRDLHGALLDAELLAQVYLLMTGGQKQLFDELDLAHSDKKTETTQVLASQNKVVDDLPVIVPTSEELVAHQQFMEKIKS